MATERKDLIPPVIVVVKDRTWRVECFTDLGTDYRFVAHRERTYLDAGGQVVKREILPPVVRTLSQVMGDPAALRMLEAIRTTADRWAQEDIDAAAQG